MAKRKLERKSISDPDKTHIHHRLLGLGFSHRITVLLVYGFSYLFALSALMLHGAADYIQFIVLLLLSTIMYALVRILATSEVPRRFLALNSDSSIRLMRNLRISVKLSRYLITMIKGLLIATFALAIVVTPDYSSKLAIFNVILFFGLLAIIKFGSRWSSSLFQTVIFFCGLVAVITLECNNSRSVVAGIDIYILSNILFYCLLTAAGIKIILRRRVGQLITTPIEYLILFMVIAVSLFPTDPRLDLILLTAKSVSIFVAYKLILTKRYSSNRKILVATSIALLVLILRFAAYHFL